MVLFDQFRFDLFDPAYSDVLSNCKFINLPFEIPNICEEVNFLLTQCGETFFLSPSDSILIRGESSISFCGSHYNLIISCSQDDTNRKRKLEPVQCTKGDMLTLFQSNFHERCSMCLQNANVVLDLAWEKINTGHWKDVDKNWRDAYTLGSLFKVLCLLLKKPLEKLEILKLCDMGLMMGTPLMQNVLSKIAFKISSSLMAESDQESLCEREIKELENCLPVKEDLKFLLPVCENISPSNFKSTYLECNKPVRLKSAIMDWPALSSSPWSIEYILKRAKYRTVPIEIGSKYTDDKWTQKLMTVGEFVNEYILHKKEPEEIGYLAQYNIFDQIPELFDDIKVPTYITENFGDVDVDISIYFGPSGTISPLHHDPKHNLLAQVIGEKYIRLYSKEMTELLYPRYNTWLSNTSEVDAENPDLEAFPLFKDAQCEECVLKAGDLLYIPPGYWHYVRSCSVSLSISFWWNVPS